MGVSCTCIVPFYNEEERIVWVLNKITKVTYFEKFILVNDWSTDQWEKTVENYIKDNKLRNVSLISYKKNKWKSHAVYTWLQKVNSKYVFLFDADLTNIKNKEITSLIESINQNPKISMWILKRIHAKRYIKILYRELILSGQRMLTTVDLKDIYKNKFDKYQLEVAINTYMQKNSSTIPIFCKQHI
jgi:glycosyltransferase involved in cell wall biosynthesis